jgi:hypothetical protein
MDYFHRLLGTQQSKATNGKKLQRLHSMHNNDVHEWI